ncbi:hypothetical protein [Aquimarina sp. AU474]|uniref:hypothetical protein n=1 Tax=Aquimarina sp. AU474 TaxID=2108529 RepID=UPI000D692940|nr:hypothetical protein [Aquimarina sp. AU474]
MYLYKIKYSLFALGVLLLGCIGYSQNNEIIQELFLGWQTSNCSIGEEKQLIKKLRVNADFILPVLIRGFEEGPSIDYLKTVTQAEIKRLRINQETIANQSINTGLSEEDLKIAREINIEQEEGRIQKGVRKGWKTRALTGIGYLNTEDSKAYIQEILKDEKNEFNPLLKSILHRNKK